MTCKHCGKSNRDDATVCKYCGKELAAEPKPKPKPSRADAQSAAIQSLRQITLILMAAVAVALILALVGTIRGCSAAGAAEEAKLAAEAAKTAADAAQASADQSAKVLQQALQRIETLEDATVDPEPTTTPGAPTTNDNKPDEPMARRYPATDPTVTLSATLTGDGKVATLAYVDANGAAVALEIGTAGIPLSYVLNDTDKLVAYESDIDLCAACAITLDGGYTGELSYRWESLSDAAWEPRPDKTEQCLTVSPGYWFSTRNQYRCQITLTIRDASGAETDSVSVYTTAVTYTDWENYAEAHSEEHDVFLQWSDMMKTYQ